MMNVRKHKSQIEKKGWLFLFLCIIGLIGLGIILYWLTGLQSVREFFDRWSLGEKTFSTLVKEEQNLTIYFQWIGTMTTIVAAAVIFFYTMMNQTQHGIPNRKIIAYSFGSTVVPGLFVFVLILGIPSWILSMMMGHIRVAIIIGGLLYLTDVFLLMACIVSSMRFFCVRVIMWVEHKQFSQIFLVDDENLDIKDNDVFYHIELLSDNNELRTERLGTIRKILQIPFWMDGGIVFTMKFGITIVDASKAIYQYLYNNVTILIQKVLARGVWENDGIDQVYSMLYEYLKDLNMWLEEAQGLLKAKEKPKKKLKEKLKEKLKKKLKEKLKKKLKEKLKKKLKEKTKEEAEKEAKEEAKEEAKKKQSVEYNYIAAWTAIVGAVITSSGGKKEEFCKYVINRLLNDSMRVQCLSVYFAYLEHLNIRKNREELDGLINQIPTLESFAKWDGKGNDEGEQNSEKNDKEKRDKKAELACIAHFWDIWFENSTISDEVKRMSYCRFSACFEEVEYDSPVMAYINLKIREEKNYVKNDSVKK